MNALIASGALAATAISLAVPAVATAAPKEWDIGSYDGCVARVEDNWDRGKIASENLVDAYRECCEKSGGVWSNEGLNSHCVAPPAEAEWTRDPGRLPTGVLEPLRPTTHAVEVIDAPVMTTEG